MEFAPVPKFTIKYNGNNITENISLYLANAEYVDKVEGESDELSITLDDTAGKWRGPWYPEKAAKLEMDIEYKGKKLKCGIFEIDSIEQSGPPHMVSIRALAAGISKAVRTVSSHGYESTTLDKIAKVIASKHGFTVQGKIENISIERATQHREKDLSFLKRISAEYGYVFSLRGKTLVFTKQEDLELSKEVYQLDLSEMIEYSFSDKAVEVYKESSLKYHNPKKNEAISAKTTTDRIINKDSVGFNIIGSSDAAKIFMRVENVKQAQVKTRSLLYRAVTKQNEGRIKIEGNPLLVAGINLMVTGLGVLSGKYHILRAQHRIDRSGGYITDIEVKRVSGVKTKSMQEPKKGAKIAAKPSTTTLSRINNRDNVGFNIIGQ